jgi:hypothetical protein
MLGPPDPSPFNVELAEETESTKCFVLPPPPGRLCDLYLSSVTSVAKFFATNNSTPRVQEVTRWPRREKLVKKTSFETLLYMRRRECRPGR